MQLTLLIGGMFYLNKYCGLLELKYLGLPCVEWKEYYNGIFLNSNCKWSVRVANRYGRDTSLPHEIGVSALDAYKFADSWNKEYDLVIVSEYFKAKISGNILITYDDVVIEWTKGNSTDLTRKGIWEEHIRFAYKENVIDRNVLLNRTILSKLIHYATYIRNKYLGNLLEGKAIILEWSIIDFDADITEYHYKENEIIFYDLRIV